MSPIVLFFIVLAEGFVTISAEILTIRQLLPVVGNSVIVTSLIIGVFLLFLAYGYRKGGQYHENYNAILKKNFTLSAIWLGMGLSYAFITLFFYYFRQLISQQILIALSVYLLVVTAPLVYILGQTVPIMMNLIYQAKTTGAIGGKILHLSTIGSFLGSVLTSLLLMEYLGVAWTVLINYGLLVFIILVLHTPQMRDTLRLAGLLIGLIIVYYVNVSFEKKLFVESNAYGNYRIINRKQDKTLIINDSASSLLTDKKQGFAYIELIKRILFKDLALKDKEILVLGAGGFTLSAETTNGNHFTYVDIDKEILDIIKKHFLPNVQGQFVAEDARAFLNMTDKHYDVIVSDAYSNQRSIPAHLLTQQYFMQIRQHLRESGTAIFNIVARPTLEDAYSARVDNTIRSIFSSCMTIPLKYTPEVDNIIYVCQHNKEGFEGVYTDDRNQATLNFFNSITY